MVQCSTLWGFFMDFVVWGVVLHKQTQEGQISSTESQPKHKNKFENHSDRGRCDGLTASTNISVSPFALAVFSSSRKKKKKVIKKKKKGTWKCVFPQGNQLQVKQSAHLFVFLSEH